MVHNVFVWQKEKTICVRSQNNALNLALHAPISTISPPMQFLNHNGNAIHLNHNHLTNHNIHNNNNNHSNNNINTHSNQNHTPLTHVSQISHTTPIPVTPLSPNHSHVSFNHSYVPTYGVRTATATPPTPKVMSNGGPASTGRDGCGSVSPGMPNGTLLELSNATHSNSPHELSTLV